MKESNLPFSVLRSCSYKRIIEKVYAVGANNTHAHIIFDFCVKLSDSCGNPANMDNLTISVEDILAFIENKANHLIYDKLDDLTDDDKLFIGFMQAVGKFDYSVLNKFVIMIIKNAVIDIAVTTIKSTGNFSYATDVVTIKDIIFDKDVAEKVIEKATKGRKN